MSECDMTSLLALQESFTLYIHMKFLGYVWLQSYFGDFMRTAFPVCDLIFRSAAVLPLQKSLSMCWSLSLQNAGQADDDDEVSYVSTA